MAPAAPEAIDDEMVPRCKAMKKGEKTMEEVLEEFQYTLNYHMPYEDVESNLKLFVHGAFAREWECYRCKYREKPESAAHVYAVSHGASEIPSRIHYFCSYFLIRKCWSSSDDNREITGLMRKLIDYLHSEGIVDEEEVKSVKEELRLCDAVDGDVIMEELQKLKTQGYWKGLPPPDDHVDNTEDSLHHSDYVETYCGDMGLELEAITKEGWMFEGRLLRLPLPLIKMGVIGMEISCVKLGLHSNGQWEPLGCEDEERICGNVYPP